MEDFFILRHKETFRMHYIIIHMNINLQFSVDLYNILGYTGASFIVAQTLPDMLMHFKDHIEIENNTLDNLKGGGMVMNVVGGALFVAYGAMTNNSVIYGPFAALVGANLLGLIMKLVLWVRGVRGERLY